MEMVDVAAGNQGCQIDANEGMDSGERDQAAEELALEARPKDLRR